MILPEKDVFKGLNPQKNKNSQVLGEIKILSVKQPLRSLKMFKVKENLYLTDDLVLFFS